MSGFQNYKTFWIFEIFIQQVILKPLPPGTLLCLERGADSGRSRLVQLFNSTLAGKRLRETLKRAFPETEKPTNDEAASAKIAKLSIQPSSGIDAIADWLDKMTKETPIELSSNENGEESPSKRKIASEKGDKLKTEDVSKNGQESPPKKKIVKITFS